VGPRLKGLNVRGGKSCRSQKEGTRSSPEKTILLRGKGNLNSEADKKRGKAGCGGKRKKKGPVPHREKRNWRKDGKKCTGTVGGE